MTIIEVIPNPYIALDKDGVPQGVVGAGMPGLFIGAQLDLVATQDSGKNRFYFPLDRDGGAKKKVHLNADIVTAILAGELIVCGKDAARACGLTDKEYLEPDKALEAEKAKALAYWRSLCGPDAKVGEIPREETKRRDGETPSVPTASKQLTPTVKLTKNTEA